jgi:putative heme degradation protein
MNAQPSPERNMPHLPAGTGGIRSRLRDLASIHLCGDCELAASRAIPDIARLTIQIHELCAALGAERLRSANLEAVVRAALGAYHDGEADPLAHLRDEIGDITGGAYAP